MAAKILKCDKDKVYIEIEIKLTNSMLETENIIQSSLNEAGCLATGKALERFDTDGSPMLLGNVKFTSKGKEPKSYQTPYGKTEIERHVYQTSEGGKTYCPLEYQARIINSTTTPKFAQIVSDKYAELDGRAVARDLEKNHGRKVPLLYIQNVAESVQAIAEAKEEKWGYKVPHLDVPVATVSIGMDGANVYILGEKFKQVMVGTIGLHDKDGNRLYTSYIASHPEHGKELFKKKMDAEIIQIKNQYPNVNYIGLADGAKDNWTFLEKYVDILTLDFYHVTEYLSIASKIIYETKSEQEMKLSEWCHQLKHEEGGAKIILESIKTHFENGKYSKKDREDLQKVITYFTNNHDKMNYPNNLDKKLPIGSGITEAACKMIVKERLCKSGMKWKRNGVRVVLDLRTMIYTPDRWEQFWSKINQYGTYTHV
ncbi:MAG: ISKra4 family transposase [Leptospiraceae bacterium]|nr:ISKra4 family transposase [Chitinophagales bacterium]MCP5494899.1 ISKra4 family transposase [Leptospiraceae bacterium]MCP5495659.1 ISKra4 family transposase [Leptospiraceae bacterium]MCP5498003.1 ISKra4 family transposase [Leptospiraceae bacterium]